MERRVSSQGFVGYSERVGPNFVNFRFRDH